VTGNNVLTGEIDGNRWVCGDIPVGKGNHVYIDTRTGQGVAEICELLSRFVMFQSNKVTLPFSTKEDISQELYVLALEAIPKYDITRKANMLTFLQGHVQRRLINKYKYASEKKRRATYCNISTYKVRCPECRKFSIVASRKEVECEHCGHKSEFKRWKKYNIPVMAMTFSCLESSMASRESVKSSTPGTSGGEWGAMGMEALIGEESKLSYFLGESYYGLEVESQKRMDFLRVFNKLDKTNQVIISMLMEGHSYREISDKVGISEKAAYARVAKIIRTQKIK